MKQVYELTITYWQTPTVITMARGVLQPGANGYQILFSHQSFKESLSWLLDVMISSILTKVSCPKYIIKLLMFWL